MAAISIPIFSSQLEKSRDAADEANVRSAIAEASVDYLSEDRAGTVNYIYKIDGQGTNDTWAQSTVTDKKTMEIGGATVSAVAKTKQIDITINDGGKPAVTLSTTESKGTEGAQAAAAADDQ